MRSKTDLVGSDPTMDEDEIRAERTFSLRPIGTDTVRLIAKALADEKRRVRIERNPQQDAQNES